MSSTVLSDRDINYQLTPEVAKKEEPKSMEYHRKILESRMKDGLVQQTYVSPSDNIQSPATQKLNAFRNKHTLKKSKPQTLFAKTSTKNMQAAAAGGMFADIPKENMKKTDENRYDS